MSTNTDTESRTELLGLEGSLDDFHAITYYVAPEHHQAIADAYWAAFNAVVGADDRVVSVDRQVDRIVFEGGDRCDLDEAVSEASAAGGEAAQELFDANETAWRVRA